MFHPATKLVVVTEHVLCHKVCKLIEAGGGKGFTLVAAGGKGLHHLHPIQDQATVIEGFDNLKIEMITRDRAKAESIAEQIVKECFTDYPGVLYLENVDIARPERF